MCIYNNAGSVVANELFGYSTNPYGGYGFENAQTLAAKQATGMHNFNLYGSQNADQMGRMLKINANVEAVYPVKNGNSMNKKLESAKKYLKDRTNLY